MTAKTSSRYSGLLVILLLLLPAYDGVDRTYLSDTYIKDFDALVNTLRSNIDRDIGYTTAVDVVDDRAVADNDVDDSDNNQDSERDLEIDRGLDNYNNNENAALIADNEFNLARSHCGLDTLLPDEKLKQIALQHANYIKYAFEKSTPTRFNPHYQMKINDIASVTSTNNPYFGGLDVKNRMLNADYPNINYGITENIAQTRYYHSAGRLISPTVATLSMAKTLLAAPYHLRSLMAPQSKVVGTAVVGYKPFDKNKNNNQGYVLVTNAAATKETSRTTFSGVFTYPCQGIKETVTGLYNETPDPVKHTGRNLSTDPIGQPIYINMPKAKRIQITNIEVYDVERDVSVPTQVLSYQNDPYKNTEFALPPNEAFILPITDDLNSCETRITKQKNCGLYGKSEYRVSFDIVVNNGRVQNQSFSFRTGAVNYS